MFRLSAVFNSVFYMIQSVTSSVHQVEDLQDKGMAIALIFSPAGQTRNLCGKIHEPNEI